MSNTEQVKHFFYYIRDKFNRPKTTVCLAINWETISRGTAVCSDGETPNKKFGRMIAMGRADKGIRTGFDFFCDESDFYKTHINPNLNKIEERFLESYQKQISHQKQISA